MVIIVRDKKENQKIYIMCAYTGTWFSRAIKLFTRSKYVHLSIAFDPELKEIYSFGRKDPRHILPAGFNKENLDEMIEVYKNVSCCVYEIDVSKYDIKKLKKDVNKYVKEEEKYRYDILGLSLILVGKSYNRKYHRVCSQFVGKLLQDNDVYNFKKHYSLIRPKDFYMMEPKRVIFQGILNDYINQLR